MLQTTSKEISDRRLLGLIAALLLKVVIVIKKTHNDQSVQLMQSQNDEAKDIALQATIKLSENASFSEICLEMELTAKMLSLFNTDSIRRLVIIAISELIKSFPATKVLVLSQNLSKELLGLMSSGHFLSV